MKKLISYFDNYKTYICTAAGAIYLALISLGILPNNELVWAIIGGGTVASLRDAMNHVKVE